MTKRIVSEGMQKLFDKWYDAGGDKLAKARCASLVRAEVYEELVRRRQLICARLQRVKLRLEARMAETDDMCVEEAVWYLCDEYRFSHKRAESLIWKRRDGKR